MAPWFRPGSRHQVRLHDSCYEDRLVDQLELLIETGCYKTPSEIAAAAATLEFPDDGWALRFLRDAETAELPMELIVKELRVRAERECNRRLREIGSYAPGRRVGLTAPLPTHVLSYFIKAADGGAVLLLPDSHRPPPHFNWKGVSAITGFRAVRHAIPSFQVLVVELIKPNGKWLGNPTAADLFDTALVAPDARIFVHIRPHPHDDDDAINPNIVPRLEIL